MVAQSARKSSAFTLIELLVVVSIIAILVGILLPALGRARASTKAVKCLSNMRQLCVATANYQDVNKRYFPQPQLNSGIVGGANQASALWFNALDKYLATQEKVHTSNDPTNRSYEEFKQDPVWAEIPTAGNLQRDTRTIKMNEHFGPGGTGRFIKDNNLREPARTVTFVDGRAIDVRPGVTSDSSYGHFHAEEGTVGLRHNDGANVAFGDAHAEHVSQAIRTSTAAPSWFNEPDPKQTLVWDFDGP